MRRLIGLALLLAAVAAIAGCSGSGLGGDAPAPPVASSEDSRPAPAFSLPALVGSSRISLADLRGKPVLINFWASWCGPCKEEMPDLVAFSKAHPRMQVLGIAYEDERGDSRAFARRYEVPYPLAVDRDGSLGAKYGVTGLPYSFVLDAEGRIVSEIPGLLTAEDLEALAEQLGV